MLYKDHELIDLIKPENERESALVLEDEKHENNIILEVSGKTYEVSTQICVLLKELLLYNSGNAVTTYGLLQFKVPEKEDRHMWIVSLKSCFNCICKRTDLICKSDCSNKITAFMEKNDDPEEQEDDDDGD